MYLGSGETLDEEIDFEEKSAKDDDETSTDKKSSGNDEVDVNKGNHLYISKLHPLTREKELQRECAKYGTVQSCKLLTDPFTEDSRCFAFVTMSSAQEAKDVIKQLNGYEFDGSKITVELISRLNFSYKIITSPTKPTTYLYHISTYLTYTLPIPNPIPNPIPIPSMHHITKTSFFH
eukprot:TRINITY_DN909_c0_g1_i1.p1 TRINITY_DN909_c0_g1~~TRINITY_DN909_c0_g1_i1.p1  ORF type:complete len:185 (-),score=20.38 TRINITY_DN909_c0_g1_i1:923-1453(-)